MNKLLYALLFSVIVLSSCKKESSGPGGVKNDVSVGASYANEVFYNLDNGIVKSSPRDNWDIAFHTNIFSSTILTNGGEGVKLYAYPHDTTAWGMAADTVGLSTWPVLYNSDTTWTLGAFERNALGHPDYGWGRYSDLSHDLIGDSLFVIQLANGSYKMLWIVRKYSTLNKYVLKFANIDGTGSQTATIDCSPYTDENFIYFSIANNEIVEREPASADWDIVFTKYIQMVPFGPGTYLPYPVVGVLSNTMRISTMGTVTVNGVQTAKLTGVNTSTSNYSAATFKTDISNIGYDWKVFNNATNQYSIADSVVYFVKRPDNSVYKIVFNDFGGSATGDITFTTTKLK